MNILKMVIVGAPGKMYQALITCAKRNPYLEIVGEVGRFGDLASINQADVVIDFSERTVTASIAALCAQQGKALVIGTTGHTEIKEVTIYANTIPIVWASNYSTGVCTLFSLVRTAAQILGPNFNLEIVEMHHDEKADAPSGTAKKLAEILADVRGVKLAEELRHGRHGQVGARTKAEIGMHSLRGGDVVGEHTVIFVGQGERLELTHKASSRETFANGALRAAQWVVKQQAGLYDMMDVLGLK